MIKYKRKKKETTDRLVLTGMIMSTKVLQYVDSRWQTGLFESPYAHTIGQWCIDYLGQYNKAPVATIQDIFASKRRRDEVDEEEAQFIQSFLSKLSREFERMDKFNEPYIQDEAVQFVDDRLLTMMTQDVTEALSRGDTSAAQSAVGAYRLPTPTDKGESRVVNPFTDMEVLIDSFEKSSKPLFRLPGRAGELFNDFLVRDTLIGIMAPEKRGKTFLCYELARRACRALCNTAVFSIGDMSLDQSIRRMGAGLVGKPRFKKDCGPNLVPCLDCTANQSDECSMRERAGRGLLQIDPENPPMSKSEMYECASRGYRPCSVCKRMNPKRWDPAVFYEEVVFENAATWREVYRAGRKFVRGNPDRLRLSVHPSDSISVHEIGQELDNWEAQDGWVPDVVIIDYADVLGKEPDTQAEARGVENARWKALRALSQRKHCLVLVPTQTDMQGHFVPNLTLENFSEDKRKFAHVSGMMCINQTIEEKRLGICRLAWLLLREGSCDMSQQASILQCMEIARPLIASY